MSSIIKNIRIGVIVAICIAILSYTGFESIRYFQGPVISVAEPENGMTTRLPMVSIRGTAKNIVSISLNDRPITVDESGVFNETVGISPGLNVMKVAAKDKFGHEEDVLVEIIRKEVKSELVRK